MKFARVSFQMSELHLVNIEHAFGFFAPGVGVIEFSDVPERRLFDIAAFFRADCKFRQNIKVSVE